MSPSPLRILFCLALSVAPVEIVAQEAIPSEAGDDGAAAATVARIVDDILAGQDGAPAWDALSSALGDSPAAIPAAWFASRAVSVPDPSIELGTTRDGLRAEGATGVTGVVDRLRAAGSQIRWDDPRAPWVAALLGLVLLVMVGVPLLRKALRSLSRSPRARRRSRRRVGTGSACRDAEQLQARLASTRPA